MNEVNKIRLGKNNKFERDNFFQIADRVLNREDCASEELKLSERIKNASIIPRICLFLNATTQIFFLQRSDQGELYGIRSKKITTQQKEQLSMQNLETHRRYLKFYNVFKPFGEPGHYAYCPPRVYLTHLLNFYVIGRILFLIIAQINFIQVKNGSQFNGTSMGYTKRQSVSVEKAYELVRESGSLANVHSGLFLFFMQGLGLMLIHSYLTSLFASSKTLYLNSMSFFLSPIEERRRLKQRLKNIVAELWPIDMELIKEARKAGSLNNYYCTQELNDLIKLLDFIREEKLIDYVKPNELNVDLYNRQERVNIMTQALYVPVIFLWAVLMVYWFIVGEMSARAQERIGILQCKWFLLENIENQQQQTIIKPLINVTMFEAASFCHTQDLYKLWNETWLEDELIDQIYTPSNINLDYITWRQIFFEFLHASSSSRVKSMNFALVYAYIYVFLWTYDYFISFVDGCFYQLNWVKQLQRQLNDCNEMLDLLHEFRASKKQQHELISDSYRKKLINGNYCLVQETMDFIRRDKIERALIVTFLNYELFGREYASFRNVCNFALFYICPIVLLNSLLCYIWLIPSFVKYILADLNLIWFCNFLLVLLLNYYVATCVSLVQKIKRINKTITFMMAKVTVNSMDSLYINKLWRCRSMEDNELDKIYCLRVMGNKFSFASMVALDSYLIPLWLIFSRY